MTDPKNEVAFRLGRKIVELDDEMEKWKTYALERPPRCPIHQCGGTLHAVEWERGHEDDWQTPLLKCDNCNALFQFLRFDTRNRYPIKDGSPTRDIVKIEAGEDISFGAPVKIGLDGKAYDVGIIYIGGKPYPSAMWTLFVKERMADALQIIKWDSLEDLMNITGMPVEALKDIDSKPYEALLKFEKEWKKEHG